MKTNFPQVFEKSNL